MCLISVDTTTEGMYFIKNVILVTNVVLLVVSSSVSERK